MITKIELAKQLKIICQNAWKVETNTTMNSMMEFIVREASELLIDEIDMLKSALTDALDQSDEVYALVNMLKDEIEELKNASSNGGFQEPQGNTKTGNEGSRPKARKVNSNAQPLTGNA